RCCTQVDMLMATLDGDLQGAMAAAEHRLQRAQELGISVAGRLMNFMVEPRVLLYLGLAEEARQAFVLDALEPVLFFAALRPLTLAHLGRQAEAHDHLDQVLQRLTRGAATEEPPVWSLVCLLEAAVLTEDRKAAAALRRQLAPVASQATPLYAVTC